MKGRYNLSKKKNRTKKESHISCEKEAFPLQEKTYFILKWIAIISLLIDLIANTFSIIGDIPNIIYIVTGYIGRIAIPIFLFLSVECYHHTQHKGKHLLRLFLLAIISEIPYDYLRTGEWFNLGQQNGIFTLTLTFIMLIVYDLPIERFIKNMRPTIKDDNKILKAYMFLYRANVIGIFSVISMFALFETSWYGVLFAGLLNAARTKKRRYLWTALSFIILILPTISYNRYSLGAIIALPMLIIASYKDKKLSKDKTERPSALQSKTIKIISRYIYPISLFALGAITLTISNIK